MPRKKVKKTAAEKEKARALWRRYFDGHDHLMMSYQERLRCVACLRTACFTAKFLDKTILETWPYTPYTLFFRSFTDWPFTEAEGANCTAEKMAAAGFYLAPTDDEPDLARCFYCRQVQ